MAVRKCAHADVGISSAEIHSHTLKSSFNRACSGSPIPFTMLTRIPPPRMDAAVADKVSPLILEALAHAATEAHLSLIHI